MTIRALVMGDGVPCYGALEIVGLLLLLLLLLSGFQFEKLLIVCLSNSLLVIVSVYSNDTEMRNVRVESELFYSEKVWHTRWRP